jgi:biotin operon repressor
MAAFVKVPRGLSVSLRCTSTSALAERFGVSSRTIERDLRSLQDAGVPLYATAGGRGGYAILPDFALPPVRLSAQEATACLAALALMDRPMRRMREPRPTSWRPACQRLSVVQCRSKRSCLSRRHRLPQPARGSMRFTSTTSWHLPTSTTQRPGSLSPTRHSKPLATLVRRGLVSHPQRRTRFPCRPHPVAAGDHCDVRADTRHRRCP